jgi:hypothetical protein
MKKSELKAFIKEEIYYKKSPLHQLKRDIMVAQVLKILLLK